MAGNVDYKSKYMELRSKYMNDLDMAFRLGMEQGQQQAQQQQAADQLAQQQQMDAIAAGGGQPGQPGGEGVPGAPPEANGPPGQEQAGGGLDQAAGDAMAGQPTELDQHISKLEGAIAKSESLSKDPEVLKTLHHLVTTRKSELQHAQMKKGELAIKAISKALHKPAFKMGVTAANNLSTSAKQAVSLQHKIVNDVMAKMEAESKRASKDIKEILNVEGLTDKG